ncbi:ribosomal protein L3 [Chthoniobacter flavus Ellin428]|uniref:Large ribosomal subunit protein uL3 n=1 Tax=Chthoniobacter flavus Ellin428 TaxID=497964 RepID=B4CUX3_9BACT|nr:50S ribosomal protein L3 [Chthoniobacter flavus]EDY22361.1 ribosomal protein L3 [Chthoniobacter flavus Ellin428]TCO94626.1 large subunit ribosomal protein L3 [Chthoniobacter flavus]
MKIGLLGKKIGMTRVYDDKGKATPVTVIEAGGNTVLQTKTQENDGYVGVQVGFDVQKEQRVTQPLLGHFKKAGSEPKKLVKEFRLPDDVKLDGALDLSVSQFAVGDVVDVIGRSKGKGFQGVIRKHNMAGQGASHGSMMHRRNGAIGNRSTPGRIWKNMGMPGHMGDERVTVQNLKVVQVRPEEGVILISGAVPGANGTYIVIRPAKKAKQEAAK